MLYILSNFESINTMYMDIGEFAQIPLRSFERHLGFGIPFLESELEKPNEQRHPAADLWKQCKKWAGNLNLLSLEEDELHNVMFSIQFSISVDALQKNNKISKSYIKDFKNDKDSFLNRAYELQIASYMVHTGHSESELLIAKGRPDIKLTIEGKPHFIECKTINSITNELTKYLNAIEQNFYKAANQIAGVGVGTIFIEIENRFPSLIEEIQNKFSAIWEGEIKYPLISGVMITFWDRKPLYLAPQNDIKQPERKGQIYVARRYGIFISNPTASNLPASKFSGETIEFIDVPPVRQLLLSTIARTDDWLITSQKNIFNPGSFYSIGDEKTV